MLEEKFFSFVEKNSLIDKGKKEKIIVGLSGGSDSVCLLVLLCKLMEKSDYDISVIAVHVNHNIRGKAAMHDELFCRELSKHYGIPFLSYSYEVKKIAKENGLSEEEAGRNARYEAFSLAKKEYKATKIALAHHMDDQAETMLFNLVRGTGPKGLAGMRPQNGDRIRPLLFCEKREILEYLQMKKIDFVTDSTNESTEYSRNYIRKEILPGLNTNINQRATRNISRAGEHVCEMVAYIDKLVEEKLENLVIHQDEVKISLDCDLLKEEPSFLKRELIKAAIKKIGSLKDIGEIHLEMVEKLVDKASGKSANLPMGIVVKKSYSELVFEKRKDCGIEPFRQMKASCIFQIKNRDTLPADIVQKDYTKWFDCDKLKVGLMGDEFFSEKDNFGLELRYPKPCDYIVLGPGKKKLSRYFIDNKIPREKREKIPVIARGSEIIWVVGYRICETYKLSEDTKHVLVVEVFEQ